MLLSSFVCRLSFGSFGHAPYNNIPAIANNNTIQYYYYTVKEKYRFASLWLDIIFSVKLYTLLFSNNTNKKFNIKKINKHFFFIIYKLLIVQVCECRQTGD